MATAQILRAWAQDKFTPSNGQVTFILTQAPIDPLSVSFIINGVDYDDPVDFSVSGMTVTWLDNPFTMATTDLVSINYQ